MNWTIEKIDDGNFVKVTAEGLFDVEEHFTMLEELVSRRFWRAGTAILFDFRLLEFVGDIETVRQASANRQQFDLRLGDGKSAFLMKSLADFARGRQFQLLTENKVSSDLGVFMEEDKAVEWVSK